ncbi:3-oxoacyl-ACP synthase III [Vulgatibacter sp.]|uniref:3-oxoacyl-ACP synthase III n=1 Tax=Vulgatibacter sp. TaxID=1971226 RepID=UPI003567C46F
MRWSRVHVEAIGYELPEEKVRSTDLEARLAPLYESLRLQPGQLEALTGIRERRVWPAGTRMSDVAAKAARKALADAALDPHDLGAVVYAGVCKDDLEPATACAVAAALGTSPDAWVFDVANACLGVLNGMVEIANRIELGQIHAGLVVSAESSRHIVDQTIDRLLAAPSLEELRSCLATLTGGSGAVAVLLTDASLAKKRHRLLGGAALSAPAHHGLCRWGPPAGLLGEMPSVANTDASAILTHGVDLGKRTFARFLGALDWQGADIDKVICHQVGGGNRKAILGTLGIDERRDFSTFPTLGNMGTVALPATAAIADQVGFLRAGDRVGFLGIGSGLNCLMLGVQW